MATSGTTSWTLDIDEIALDAVDIVGGQPILGYEGRQVRRALNLLLTEWENMEIPLWKIPSAPIEQALTSGTSTYTLDSSYLDIVDAVLRTNSGDTQDLAMERLSLSSWLRIPNKEQTGRPTQYFVNRQRDALVVTLWPVPNDSTQEFVYWPFKQIEDATSMTQNADIPRRFLPALTHGLAYYLTYRRPNYDPARRADIRTLYMDSLKFATDEDRERVSMSILPKVGTL